MATEARQCVHGEESGVTSQEVRFLFCLFLTLGGACWWASYAIAWRLNRKARRHCIETEDDLEFNRRLPGN